MRVAILGCGPAGLMAAHATREAHIDVSHEVDPKKRHLELHIFSRKRKSDLFGAQYLHQPIPYITPSVGRLIRYQLRGTTDQYRRKVYGALWDGSVSPEDLGDEHLGWDLRETYNRLWSMYLSYVNDMLLHPASLKTMIKQLRPDIVINTVPLDQLCMKEHHFGFTEVIAAGDAPARGIKVSQMYKCPEDTVMCNGETHPSWYRMSNIYGHTTVEWPAVLQRVPVPTAAKVRKPTFHECSCWPNIFKVGRYGSWRKGVLTHDAYKRAYDMVYSKLSGEDDVDTEEIARTEA